MKESKKEQTFCNVSILLISALPVAASYCKNFGCLVYGSFFYELAHYME